MAQPAKVAYRPSPVGVGRYCWINKADTKFNEDGVFKVELGLEGEEAQKFKAQVDADCVAAFELETKDLSAKDKAKWTVYRPYVEETDAEDKPTGKIWFAFRQSAVITVEGVRKDIHIAIFDAKDKRVDAAIFPGTILRVMHKPRSIKVTSAKMAGARMDFLKVQVIKLADRDQAPGGFGEVEGGYVKDAMEKEPEGFGSHGNATGDF